MGELDQNQATTSTFHNTNAKTDEASVKLKRIQRFKRQFSIFVHNDSDEVAQENCTNVPKNNETKNSDDQTFKYPGNLRGIKRKRSFAIPSIPHKCVQRSSLEDKDSTKEQEEIRKNSESSVQKEGEKCETKETNKKPNQKETP